MIKSIIVEDDPKHSKRLMMLLERTDVPVEILAIVTNVEDALLAIKEKRPELLFLDIDLEGGRSGFELLQRSEKIDFDIIFTTQHSSTTNAINAIRACALDFLLKPIMLTELNASINKYFKNKIIKIEQVNSLKMNLLIDHNTASSIWISEEDRIIRVKSDNILYLHSDNNISFFHLIDDLNKATKLVSTKSIGKWDEILQQHNFCRIHNRYIVNLGYVAEYARNNTVKMINKDVLPVSKNRKEYFLKQLGLTKFH